MKPGKTGMSRLLAASANSIRGIKACWRHEAAFRQDSALSLLLLIASFFVARSATQWLLLVAPLFLLLMVELLNSAIEAVVDQVIAANPGEVEKFKGGNAKLMGFFVGQVMRETKGKANPQIVNKLLKEKLG